MLTYSLLLVTLVGATYVEASAFSVGATYSIVTKSADTIVYDRVFVNDGDLYDESTGVVTIQDDGLYFFTFHGIPLRNGSIWLDLYVSDNYVTSAYGFTGINDRQSQASQSVILPLPAGAEVDVRFHGDKERTAFGANDEVFLTFSGFEIE